VKTITVTFGLLLLLGHFLQAGSSRPEVSLSIHVEAGEEVRDDRAITIGLTDPDEIIRVERFAIAVADNLERVMGTSGGGVLLQFNQTGRHSLEAATSNRLGKTLVVFLNGRVVYSAVIDMVLRSGRLLIPDGVSPEELAMLQKFIEENRSL